MVTCEEKSMKKIIVIGSPGAGKSTFSRKLQNITGLPLFYLDMIYHRPDKTTCSAEEFDEKLNQILVQDQWIIDGNYARTLPLRLDQCVIPYSGWTIRWKSACRGSSRVSAGRAVICPGSRTNGMKNFWNL